jgi:hypothetical protein
MAPPGRRLVASVCAALLLAGALSAGAATAQAYRQASATGSESSAVTAMQRIAAILTQMDAKAFNPQAPPPSHSDGRIGGLFINWSYTWNGDLATAPDNTNFQTNGLTDSQAGIPMRHDPFTDLMYLRNLLGYRAANPTNHSFDADITKMTPVVKSDFATYSYYKCFLFNELNDLNLYAPQGGWAKMADAYANVIYANNYDQTLGTIVAESSGVYQATYASECAVALTESGRRQHNSAMALAGISTAKHLLHHAVDPTTHLLPSELTAQSTGPDIVNQKRIKIGEEAQTLDSLLTMYDLTGNTAFLNAVQSAVTWLFASRVHDATNGGFYFSIKSDGTGLEKAYKETRQAWMLALLDHLDRLEPGQWSTQISEMSTVVISSLWGAAGDGYVYRVTPQFGLYTNHSGPGGSAVIESWVTSESMGIAGQVLEGPA